MGAGEEGELAVEAVDGVVEVTGYVARDDRKAEKPIPMSWERRDGRVSGNRDARVKEGLGVVDAHARGKSEGREEVESGVERGGGRRGRGCVGFSNSGPVELENFAALRHNFAALRRNFVAMLW